MDAHDPASSPDPLLVPPFPGDTDEEPHTLASKAEGESERIELQPQEQGSGGTPLFVGTLLVLAGAALAVAPHVHAGLQTVAATLSAAGIHSGTLMVGGLILAGLGHLAPRRSSPIVVELPERSDDEPFRLVADQLHTHLNQLRTTTLQVAEDVAGMAEFQRAFFQRLDGRDDLAQEHRDALFRLAASLDKLNAHFDERIHALDLQVRSGLDGVIHALSQTRHQIEATRGSVSPSAAAPPSPAGPELQVSVDLEGTDTNPLATGETGDFLGTTLDRLDQISGEAAPPSPLPAEPHKQPLDVVQQPPPKPPHPQG